MKKTRAPASAPQSDGWRWLTRPWGVMMVVGGVIGAVLLNINPILTNVRQLPAEARATRDQFFGWYYQDDRWSGRWTNRLEGYVDMAELGLSAEDVELDLSVENGLIDGTISTPRICNALPFDFLLLRGNVSVARDSAKVVVWDTIQGRNLDIAALTLKREGAVMTIVPKEGTVRLFPAKARVAFDPTGSSASFSCDRLRQRQAP